MRLLLCSYYYPPSVGGVERQSHLLARGLVARGHSAHVVTARLGELKAHEELDGVPVTRISPGKGSRWQKMATYLAGMISTAARLRPAVDVIQVQQALYPAAAMAIASILFRRPLIVRNSGRGYFGGIELMRRMPLGSLASRMTGAIAAGVSLSEEMSNEMRRAGFRRIVRIPNGVELPPFTTLAAREAARRMLGIQGPTALYAGRLEAEKGVDALIRAWRGVRTLGARLLIVGDGPEREALVRLAAQDARSASTIRFCGLAADIAPYFQAADLFVMPSHSEGMSNAILEAMAYRLPVVATDVPGNSELIAKADVGVLVPGQDTSALAAALVELLDNPDRANRLGCAARAYVATRYSVDAMLDAYEQLYFALCAQGEMMPKTLRPSRQ